MQSTERMDKNVKNPKFTLKCSSDVSPEGQWGGRLKINLFFNTDFNHLNPPLLPHPFPGLGYLTKSSDIFLDFRFDRLNLPSTPSKINKNWKFSWRTLTLRTFSYLSEGYRLVLKVLLTICFSLLSSAVLSRSISRVVRFNCRSVFCICSES